MKQNHRILAWLTVVVGALSAAPVAAHVKWFSQSVDLEDRPLSLAEILTPTFFGLALLSIVVVVALMLLDDPIQKLGAYKRLRAFLVSRQEHAGAVMRIATGMTLLLCWQGNVVLAPDLSHGSAIVSWMQFVAIVCLLDPRTTPIAGGLVWALFGVGVAQFGVFHMLDYAAFVGVGFYLVFQFRPTELTRRWVTPVLFGSTGFSLAWLALEKLVFPTWGLVLLEHNPVLALGLPPGFFLTAAAFIELSLGYLLVLGVLGRPLALIITLVFFLTTMVFGKDEVVGHLILHGVLIVFMLEGTSQGLTPPFRLHRNKALRTAFVAVNFAVALGVLLVAYQSLAVPRRVEPLHADVGQSAVSADNAPSVTLRATPKSSGGFVLDVDLERFRIDGGGPEAPGDDARGHVHLFVNGVMKEMIFTLPHELPPLEPGQHELKVQLSAPDHRTLTFNGAPIESSVTVVQN